MGRTYFSRHVQTALVCFALVGCAGTPRLEDGLLETDYAGCSDLGKIANDRSQASPEQLKHLAEGKAHFRDRQFGLAEVSFRSAVEAGSFGKSRGSRLATLEAMFGLAASYDQLKRFDLSDQIYDHIRTEYGPSITYYNNYGYSLQLRGESQLAEQQFVNATKLGPECKIAKNNLTAAKTN